jgi:hypothetical protein
VSLRFSPISGALQAGTDDQGVDLEEETVGVAIGTPRPLCEAFKLVCLCREKILPLERRRRNRTRVRCGRYRYQVERSSDRRIYNSHASRWSAVC